MWNDIQPAFVKRFNAHDAERDWRKLAHFHQWNWRALARWHLLHKALDT